MATYLLNTSQGKAYFWTSVVNPTQAIKAFQSSVIKGNIKGIKPGVTVQNITPITQQQFSSRTGVSSPTSTASRTTTQPLSVTDQVNKALSDISKQIQQVQQSVVKQQQTVPSTLGEQEKLREQVGIPGLQEQLTPLQTTAKSIGERLRGLPEELKTRFQEFLIPEQFRSRKEDVERGGLTTQLQDVTGQQEVIQSAIDEGEDRVSEAMKFGVHGREAQLDALQSALKYLYDSRTQLQKQQTALVKAAKSASGKATTASSKAKKEAEKVAEDQTFKKLITGLNNYSALLRRQGFGADEAKLKIKNVANIYAAQYPSLASKVRSHANSVAGAYF